MSIIISCLFLSAHDCVSHLLLSQLLLDGSLTSCDRTYGAGRAALPFAVRILSFQANEAEIAATFAFHVFASLKVVDEQAALGTGPGVWTAFHVSDLLRATLSQYL